MATPNAQNIDDIVRAILSDAQFQDSIVKIVHDIVASVIQKAEKTIESQPAQTTAPTATKKTVPAVKAPARDWSHASQASLFQAFYRRRNKGAPIEDDLNRAMAATFPTYDAEKQAFVGARQKNTATQVTKQKTRTRNYEKNKKSSLRTIFYSKKRSGAEIDDALNEALTKAFPTYDPIARNFSTELRKKSIRDCADGTLRNKYYEAYARGNIPSELNQVLAERFPDYNPTTQKFTTPRGRHKKPADQPKPQSHIIPDTPNTNVPAGTNVSPKPTSPEKSIPATPAGSNTTKQTASSTKIPAHTAELEVTVKQVKITQDGVYNNIYVNVKRLLHNHVNTAIEFLADNTLMAVHGTVTDNKNLPSRPLYMIYSTDLQVTRWASRDKFSGYSVYAKNIIRLPDTIRIELSNRCTIILDPEREKRRAGLVRFKLMTEKTK